MKVLLSLWTSAAICVPVLALAADAAYPTRPIRLLVPYGPGGNADILGRLVGARMAEAMGQPVIIDNRPGASGLLGSEIVARSSAPDGYTLLWGANGHATNPAIVKKMPFDTAKDLASVSLASSTPMLLVAFNGLPVENMKTLIAYAKARPSQVNYASSGNGSPNNFAGELLNLMAGMKLDPTDSFALMAMFLVTGGLLNAVQTTMYALAAHVYPTQIRSTGVGTAVAFGRVGNVLAVYVGGFALDRGGDFLPRIVGVVVPADRHRRELRQIADDHFGGIDQLDGELTVSAAEPVPSSVPQAIA